MTLLVIPLLTETPFVLTLWLKDVPEYTIPFFRLSLIISIFEAISLPLSQAVGATGRLKYYQISVGGILLLILPISYSLLKLGGSPIVVYVVHLVISLLAFMLRLLFVKKMIGLNLKIYTLRVMLRSFAIVLIACPAIFYFHASIKDTFFNHIAVLFFACFAMLFVSIIVGFSNVERKKILTILKQKINLAESCK